jgi:hypothetical protein
MRRVKGPGNVPPSDMTCDVPIGFNIVRELREG